MDETYIVKNDREALRREAVKAMEGGHIDLAVRALAGSGIDTSDDNCDFEVGRVLFARVDTLKDEPQSIMIAVGQVARMGAESQKASLKVPSDPDYPSTLTVYDENDNDITYPW